jgi:hypothetical protein
MDKQDVPPWDTLENLSVQSPLVRGVWGSEQKAVFPGDLSSLVGRPSSREGARACAPGAASDRMGKRRKAPYSKFGVTAKPLLSTLSSLLSPLSAAGRRTPGGQGRRTSFVCGDLGAGSPTSYDLQPKPGRHRTVDLGLGPLQGMKCKFGGSHVSSGRSPGHSDRENSDRRVWRMRAEEAERGGRNRSYRMGAVSDDRPGWCSHPECAAAPVRKGSILPGFGSASISANDPALRQRSDCRSDDWLGSGRRCVLERRGMM